MLSQLANRGCFLINFAQISSSNRRPTITYSYIALTFPVLSRACRRKTALDACVRHHLKHDTSSCTSSPLEVRILWRRTRFGRLYSLSSSLFAFPMLSTGRGLLLRVYSVMAGQPHGGFFLFLSPQSLCMYYYYPWCWASTIQPVLLRSTYVLCSMYFPLLFSPWSSVPVTFSLSKSSS